MSKLSSGVLLVVAERVKPGVCVYTWGVAAARANRKRMDRCSGGEKGEKKERRRDRVRIGRDGERNGGWKENPLPFRYVCVYVYTYNTVATRGPGINVDETELVYAHRLRRSHLMKYTSQLCRS